MKVNLLGRFPSKSNNHATLDEEGVRAELECILTSPEFKGKSMLQGFLRFIVEQTLGGHAHEIKGYTVATQVFARKEDFDPARDPIVRIQAGRLRRALERYYQTVGKDAPVRIEVPLGGYVPVIHSPGEGRGGHRESPQAPPDPMLMLSHGPSLAVMPLLNLTGDPGQEYFADGLTEELTSEIARYQDLRVVSCRSAMRRKGKDVGVRELGLDLGVRFVLEGSVRREADRVKIGVRLVDTTTRVQLWGEQYRRELRADSLIALQEEISRRVAARIGSEYGIILQTLSRESRNKPTDSLQTYEALLRFYHYIATLTPEAFAETLQLLEKASIADPGCGMVWSLLAFLYDNNCALQIHPMETPLAKALAFAQKGAALEPQNQLARTALATLYFRDNNRELFFKEAERALALNPNAPGIVGYLGWMMALYGDWEYGLALLQKGMELNPLYPGWYHMAPYFHFYHQGHYEKAYHHARQVQMPQFFWDPLLRAAVLGQLGRTEEAQAAIAELLQVKSDFAATGLRLISHFVKLEELLETLLEGVRKAGLEISDDLLLTPPTGSC